MGELEMHTPDTVKVVQVIETKCCRGAGKEGNPIRIVTQHWSFSGELLAESDPEENRKS